MRQPLAQALDAIHSNQDLTTWQPVTLWFRQEWDDKLREKVWVMSHLQDGHADGDTPSPKLDPQGRPFSSQLGWRNGTWRKEHRFLDEHRIVVSPPKPQALLAAALGLLRLRQIEAHQRALRIERLRALPADAFGIGEIDRMLTHVHSADDKAAGRPPHESEEAVADVPIYPRMRG